MTMEDDLEKGMPISTISPYALRHHFWRLLKRNFGASVDYLLSFYLTRYFKPFINPFVKNHLYNS